MQKQDRPVAFFDSGLGGISVLRETVRLLPQENYLYYGDSLHAPYGVKSEAQIQALSLAAAEHLVSAGAKAIVVACNTATSAAIGLLRQVYPDIPVIGTEPALKPAVEKYPGGRILVMATPMTIKQEKFQALKHQFDDRAQIIGLPCEGLMEFVERGELRGSAVEAYLTEKLAPYLREPVDGIVLGCTHFPLLLPKIQQYMPDGITTVTQGELVADSLKDYLHRHPEMDKKCTKGGRCVYRTTESEEKFTESASTFLNESIRVERIEL